MSDENADNRTSKFNSPDTKGDNDRFEKILAELIEAEESGTLGDVEGFVQKHAEFEKEIRDFLKDRKALELTNIVGHGFRDAATIFRSSEKRGVENKSLETVKYFGDYELTAEIARGGMGVVYRAMQTSLNRTVAIKMILAGGLASERDVERFKTEAESAAHLNHPNIVPIYEIGEHEGQHYFSMALIEGESLDARVQRGPLPPKEAAQLVKKLADAVQYAHDQGVIHRDLKPSNVLIDRSGNPMITDFGLAKRDDRSGLTATGEMLGTPGFMAPEQTAARAMRSPNLPTSTVWEPSCTRRSQAAHHFRLPRSSTQFRKFWKRNRSRQFNSTRRFRET